MLPKPFIHSPRQGLSKSSANNTASTEHPTSCWPNSSQEEVPAASSVLIVEDDPTLLRGLTDNFLANGYSVQSARDGEEGLAAALENPPNLVLLDGMLPRQNGFEVCDAIRRHRLDMPIIMLTALSQRQHIVRGLSLGADDYVTKPFDIGELLARANALLRRSPSGQRRQYRFGNCLLDLSLRKLYRSGREVALTRDAFRLLTYFVEHPERTHDRGQLRGVVHDKSWFVTGRRVDRCVAELHEAMGPSSVAANCLQVVGRHGYRFKMPMSKPSPASSALKALPHEVSDRGERYHVGPVLGRGGMGVVYWARDLVLDRDVALKVIDPGRARDAELLRRFEMEAIAVAALSHRNIRAIYDVSYKHGEPFAVMEYLDGSTLQDCLSQLSILVPGAVTVAAGVADGLAAAHQKGIVHRDVKPANIFITKQGGVKLLDFGLACLASRSPLGELISASAATCPGQILGTVTYMSPEQARGQEMDARTDVFSLGAVLYELLFGEAPFARDSAADTLAAILHDRPRFAEMGAGRVPSNVVRILRRCLQKDRAKRYAHAGQLHEALSQCHGELPSLNGLLPT